MAVLNERVALVTGAGRGFGRAIAERFAAEGARVALLSRSRDELNEVVEDIREGGGEAIAVACDVSDADSIAAAVAETRRALGSVDLLVNNAGIPGPFGPIWDVDPEEWWRAQAIHIRAPMLFMHHLLPGMVARDFGHVICVSAIASRLVAPHLSAYCTGKIAVNRVVAEAAAELAESKVAVFAIDPGFAATQLARRDTAQDPVAKQYFQPLIERIASHPHEYGEDPDLARCAQRCVDLASGRYDALSGGYFELPDDLDEKLAEKRGGDSG